MKEKKYLNSIALILFALMLFKVSSFHSYTHQDTNEIENCNSCELAFENNNKFIIVALVVIATPIFVTETYEPTLFYELVLSSSFLYTSFFERPPPHVS